MVVSSFFYFLVLPLDGGVAWAEGERWAFVVTEAATCSLVHEQEVPALCLMNTPQLLVPPAAKSHCGQPRGRSCGKADTFSILVKHNEKKRKEKKRKEKERLQEKIERIEGLKGKRRSYLKEHPWDHVIFGRMGGRECGQVRGRSKVRPGEFMA